MVNLSCITVEDNPIDSDYLKSLIKTFDILDLKASFENAIDANSYLQSHCPDILFLDIDMPHVNGMQFFKQLKTEAICVFVTAHSEYAWAGFETHAFDFILKPVKAERFANCVDRIVEYRELLRRSNIYESQIDQLTVIIKEGYTTHRINMAEILYIEALKDYSKIVTANGKFMVLSNLKQFLDNLPAEQFVRIHRSYAIAINKITKIHGNEVHIGQSVKLLVGKTYKNILKSILCRLPHAL
jgi:DNA-binding LytR/AlgR family response regulator